MDAYARALEYARTLGAEHGANAASWVIDGRTNARTAADILRGIEDGDPAVLDTLPAPDLSGQWADTLTGPQLVRDAADAVHDATGAYPHIEGWFADVCDAYETAYSEAVESAIADACRAVLA